MYIVPETVTRLQAQAYVLNAELSRVNRHELIRRAMTNMAEMALAKILRDCIRTDEYQGQLGQNLALDVFVLSPLELHRLVEEAYAKGIDDGRRWGMADEH